MRLLYATFTVALSSTFGPRNATVEFIATDAGEPETVAVTIGDSPAEVLENKRKHGGARYRPCLADARTLVGIVLNLRKKKREAA